ncbi:BatA domain-containing protein [Phycisphaerales bacterium AB-hyl4]|uniref:BatA domain-containing protein n=1 Tax=Natronomicrosphaera hydrolytica TaxID=3242702 RepID=A0ABV4U605_9BACT
MPVFVLPLALLGLTALPALAAIYWLRNRHRRQVVSSLLLWVDERQPREGGVRVRKAQTSLLFLLELIALLLLATAAADPRVLWSEQPTVYVVVLDDAFSMQAGEGDDTARARAVAALRDELRGQRFAVRFVLAGERAQLLGEPVERWPDAARVLEGWRCESPRSSLPTAVAMAREIGGAEARVIVLTDREPTRGMEAGRLLWWAFGASRANVAFVNAVRSVADGAGDRAMLEIANLSDEAARPTLSVNGASQQLTLATGERRRLWFDLPADTGPLIAELSDDALAFDNRVVLQPARAPRVSVALAIADERSREMWRQALAATGRARLVSGPADVLITDAAAALPSVAAGTWTLRLRHVDEPAALTGPYIIDQGHPLNTGLSLAGVVWAGGREVEMPGMPLISAGEAVLLSHVRRGAGADVLHMQWRPDLSTLPRMLTFPALVWNLLDWRADHLPGPSETNLRLGMMSRIVAPPGVDAVELISPTDERHRLTLMDAVATWEATRVGEWQVRVGEEAYAVAVNALEAGTSDLRGATSGRWGDRLDERSLTERYQAVSWVLLLVVLGALTLHGYFVWRGGSGSA